MKAKSFNTKPLKLLIGAGGIYFSYIYQGVVTERMFSKDYSGPDQQKLAFPPFIHSFSLLFQNLFSFILAALVNRLIYRQAKSTMNVKSELSIAVTSFISTLLTSQALGYVSFPVQSIMKSSKIISILLVSFILRRKGNHTRSQYLCGFLITAGIILFNLNEESKKGRNGGDQSTSIIGIVIICISLFCDGLLGAIQTDAKKNFNPTAWDQMESLNKWGFLIYLGIALVSCKMMEFLSFVTAYPAVLQDLMMIAVLGTTGQVFIFYTIANFSPLVLSIVTTTRKFITVLLSIIIHSHSINGMQWISIGLVFCGAFMEILGGKKVEKEEKEKVTNGKVQEKVKNEAEKKND